MENQSGQLYIHINAKKRRGGSYMMIPTHLLRFSTVHARLNFRQALTDEQDAIDE